jgi:hypothetical protein
MKSFSVLLTIVLVVMTGCIVVPVGDGGYYGHHYHRGYYDGYGDNHGYYRH